MKMSGDIWLFFWAIIYMIVGMFNLFIYKFTEIEYIQMVWLSITSMPLVIRPIANWCNMRVLWDI